MNIPGGATIYGMGNSHDRNSGSYNIEGHAITFHYNDGRAIRHLIWAKDKDQVYKDQVYMMNKAFLHTKPE